MKNTKTLNKLKPLNATKKILVIGYGNPGRQDDGLGPVCATKLEALGLNHITVDISYQLAVEHADDMAGVDIVIFIDAMMDGDAPFSFYPIDYYDDNASLASHSLSTEALVTLCKALYSTTPECHVLGIRGYQFDRFDEKLSARGLTNLNHALEFIIGWLGKRTK